MNIKQNMQGFYKIEAVNKDSGESRIVADWFPNLITDLGLNRAGTNNWYDYCMVGTGSSAPAITDTTLQNQIASTTTTTSTNTYCASTAPYFGAYVKTFRFDIGTAAGNLSEVGIGWGSSTIKSCFSRALILDGSGNPTTITILSNEYLDVTYEIRSYAPSTDSTFSVSLDGTTYSCLVRPARVTNPTDWAPSGAGFIVGSPFISTIAYDGPVGAVTSTPSGANAIASLRAVDTYINNSLTASSSFTFGLTVANFATGIKSILIPSSIGSFQIEFTPAIPKNNTKTFLARFAVSWARR